MGDGLAMPLRDDDPSTGCRGSRNLSGVRLERALRGRQSGVPRVSDAPAFLLVPLVPGAGDAVHQSARAGDAVHQSACARDALR